MTGSRRYEVQVDQDHTTRIDQNQDRVPCTLPSQAYGPNPIEWVEGVRPEVWAWMYWIGGGPATRVPCVVKGFNDRVVVVTWIARGGEKQAVVWRNAVTRRNTKEGPLPQTEV